jgi:hypothetical protein
MRPILTALTAATALVGVGVSGPTPASANPIVIAPLAAAAIVGGAAVGGVALGAAASHAAPVAPGVVPVPASPTAYYGYEGPVGNSYGGAAVPAYGSGAPYHGAAPAYDGYASGGPCYITRARVGRVLRRVQVCD